MAIFPLIPAGRRCGNAPSRAASDTNGRCRRIMTREVLAPARARSPSGVNFSHRPCGMNYSPIALLVAVVCIGIARSGAADERTLDQYRSELQGLRSEIQGIVGDAACTYDSECKAIGYGSKPCGGPSSYLPYSVKNTDVPLLEGKVRQFNALQRAYQGKLRIASDCMVVPKPVIMCEQKRCTKLPKGPRAAQREP